MNDIPLTHASFSEVLARVAYRLIERRLSPDLLERFTHDALIRHLARQLDWRGWSALSFWVNAYLYRFDQGELEEFTRTAFIMRARLGMDFRSVAFADYKATRRRDPRVTNRGVTASATKRGR